MHKLYVLYIQSIQKQKTSAKPIEAELNIDKKIVIF